MQFLCYEQLFAWRYCLMTDNKQVEKRLLTMTCVSEIPIMRTTSPLKLRHSQCIIDYCGFFGGKTSEKSETWKLKSKCYAPDSWMSRGRGLIQDHSLQARNLNGRVSAFETHDMCLYFQENVEHCVRSWKFVSLCASASATSDQGIGRQQRSLKAQSN